MFCCVSVGRIEVGPDGRIETFLLVGGEIFAFICLSLAAMPFGTRRGAVQLAKSTLSGRLYHGASFIDDG